MTSRTALTGGGLAVAAALLVDHAGSLGLGTDTGIVLGLALGAVLALVPGGTSPGRVAAAAGGLVVGWAGYALRAGALPDIPLGRAIAAFAVVAAVTLVAVATRGRAPLWAGLLGVAALTGAYEASFAGSPTTFTTDSVDALSRLALALSLGLLAATAVSWVAASRSAASDDAADDGGTAAQPRAESAAPRTHVRLPGARAAADSTPEVTSR